MPDGKMPDTAMKVDAALVRELAGLLKETDLSEIEVQDGERRIRVARQFTIAANVPMPAAAPAPVAAAAAPAAETAPSANAVPSPMVGTVYLASEPGKPEFITEGQSVKEGDTLMIIEAMKVMNPILAPRGGTVRRILVANAQPVEYGEPLVVID